jgi:predicted NBD/HSP70 family sugar kinase
MKEILQVAQGQSEPAGISTTIGLDLGDRWSRYCVVDRSGTVIEEDRVRTSTVALEHRFRQMPSIRIVVRCGSADTLAVGQPAAGEPGPRGDRGKRAQGSVDLRERSQERPVGRAHVGTIRQGGCQLAFAGAPPRS